MGVHSLCIIHACHPSCPSPSLRLGFGSGWMLAAGQVPAQRLAQSAQGMLLKEGTGGLRPREEEWLLVPRGLALPRATPPTAAPRGFVLDAKDTGRRQVDH